MNLKTLKACFLFTISLCVMACSGGGEIIGGDDDNTTPDNGNTSDPVQKITVSTKEVKTSVLGETLTFTLESTGDWEASASEPIDWITLSPSLGFEGVFDIDMTIKPNTGDRARSVDVVFTSGNQSAKIKVSQEWSQFFKVPCTSYKISYAGGRVVIDGLPKTDFTIAIPAEAQEWISVSGNCLNVAFNENEGARKAKISITDNTIPKTYNVTLTQSGVGKMTISELYIDGYKCLTDKRGIVKDFMYSVDMDAATKPVKIEFYGEGVQWITVGSNETKIYSGDIVSLSDLKANSNLNIYSHCETSPKIGTQTLVVSGLPIVEIITNEDVRDEPKVDCTFRLFDPKARTDDGDNKNLTFFESKGGIEYRGAGAMRYIKKPYNLKLYDDAGEKREAELLNIRNDNSWILDAMFLDVAHMRNRVCFDIWNQFNKPYYVSQKPKAMSGTRGHHVEMFLNGEYRGLFVLSDRIDRKQYQIEQNGGYIYKATGWGSACCLTGCSTPSNNSYTWSEIEQKYPDADDGQKPNFNYMADMINFVSGSSKEDFSAKFEENFDINSVVDGFIFLNMIVAEDNVGRNTFWILRNVNESKKFIHGLWDLDGTLGRTWNRYTENPEQGWLVKSFRIYRRIIDENPANIHQKIYDRWNELKDGALAPENFNQVVDYYAKQMIDSGARDREVKRWQSLDRNDRPNWGYADVYFNNPIFSTHFYLEARLLAGLLSPSLDSPFSLPGHLHFLPPPSFLYPTL